MKGDKGERVSDGIDFGFIISLDLDFPLIRFYLIYLFNHTIRNSGVLPFRVTLLLRA